MEVEPMSAIETQVKSLIEKAANSSDKDDAMRFSQAALNAAHAANVLTGIPPDKSQPAATEDQIKHMVDRFLSWKLPENFNPDGGISFKAAYNEHTAHPAKHEPSGTNLFGATQATAMVRYMLEGIGAKVGRLEVFVCSNPKCRAVHAENPQGHCPACITTEGVGFSTSPRVVIGLDPDAEIDRLKQQVKDLRHIIAMVQGAAA
jgi:hypothetical protein